MGLAIVAGFTTAMIIVNKKDEETVKSPNSINKNPSGWKPDFNAALSSKNYSGPLMARAEGVDNAKLKIANWNLKRY